MSESTCIAVDACCDLPAHERGPCIDELERLTPEDLRPDLD